MKICPPALLRFLASFRYAWEGWNQVLSTQRNMRIHVCIALGLCVLCVPLSLEVLETALLLLLVGLVLAAELVNSAIEAAVDLAAPSRHPLAKAAKDAAAAAVLVLALLAVALFFVLFARFWPLLKNALQTPWPPWTPPWPLLCASWLLSTLEGAWLCTRPVAWLLRLAAFLLWLGAWPYVANFAFWGLGLFLLAARGLGQKAPKKMPHKI